MSMRMQLPATKYPRRRSCAARVLRSARAAARGDRRGRGGRVHDQRAAVRRPARAGSRSRGVRRASRRSSRRRSATVTDQPGVLRRPWACSSAAGRGFSRDRRHARRRDHHHQRAARRAVLPRARIRSAAASASSPAPARRRPASRRRSGAPIVGISPTIRHLDPQDARAEPRSCTSRYRQEPPGFATLLVRSRLPPGGGDERGRDARCRRIDPDQPVFTVQTLEQMLAQQTWPYRVFGDALRDLRGHRAGRCRRSGSTR